MKGALLGFGVFLVILCLYLDSLVPDHVVLHRTRVVTMSTFTIPFHFLIEIGERWFNYGHYHWYRLSSGSQPMDDGTVKAYNDVIEGVPVRIYTPYSLLTSKVSPGIVMLHGGGFCGCSVDAPYHMMVMDMANRTNSIIISVDYRLAPEHPYPAGLNDALSVTKHVALHADKYGINSNKLYIAGESAGGNFAAVIDGLLAEEKHIHINGVILMYPTLQLVTFDLPSFQTESFACLTKRDMARFVTSYFNISTIHYHQTVMEGRHVCKNELSMELYAKYLKPEYLSNNCDEELYNKMSAVLHKTSSPLFNKNVSALSPTLLLTANADILRDEGILYYNRLKNEGVNVQLKIYDSAPHGFISELGEMYSPTQYNQAIDDIAHFIKKING